jgi:gliding motility-associated-like protein
LCAILITATAAVPVHINSGNPRYPFPQFLEYAAGGNLGTKNAEGVVHAEMEQDIRDAYQIHANEFVYTGQAYKGIKYIYTAYKAAYDCTEGDGYGLLAAAYMADKVTFDGYWMCTHDKRRVKTKRYADCSDNASDYGYGDFAISDNGTGGNTATDGDVDVALALYVAYMQWGEFMLDDNGNKVLDACGEPISYKKEMINVIRGLVARSTRFPTENPQRSNSGDIGFDGYVKGGDTWVEQTTWAQNNPTDFNGIKVVPEFQGSTIQHIDYNAPSYFREFRDILKQVASEDPSLVGSETEWEQNQFKRAEASSDWLIGQLIAKNSHAIPTAGNCSMDANNIPTFSNFNEGEDYRCSWRNICNYMWHGNPEYTWNPTSHQALSGGNTYEHDAAVRMAKFLNDPAHWNPDSGSTCTSYATLGDLYYSGPATIVQQYDPMTGIAKGSFPLNWQNGTGSYSAVGAQDYELMGLLYRQCDIEWDVNGGTDNYLNSKPGYMHGWARQMGMMVLSGNYPAPSQMLPKANMKIYRAIKDSITYCYTGDTLTYILDYRNYGSVDASGVKIVENVPADFIVKKVYGGGVYNASTGTITWNIGTVAGYKSDNTEGPALDFTKGNLAKTIGQVRYTVQAGPNASGRYCTTADITCTNGYGWTSNEYPNYITPTMQRNCVDVVKRSLKIEKSADREKINTDNVATFTIKFENSSDAGWIDGGRPRVNVSYSCGMSGSQFLIRFRLFDDAIEPYINYGNYRISYYLYDAGLNCYTSESGCTTGWNLTTNYYADMVNQSKVKVSHENIIEGSDSYGKWNQRFCIQFAPLLVTTTMHLNRYYGMGKRVHKGGTIPMLGIWALAPSNSSSVDFTDDWSYGSAYTGGAEQGLYYPITPSRQRLDSKGQAIVQPINHWLTCGCDSSSITVPNILVEEYDGYVWRRILGTGPMAGRDVDSVYVRDTLPKGMAFVDFVGSCPLEESGATMKHSKLADGRDVIEWFIPKMQVKQKGTITYTANITFPSGKSCQTDDETIVNTAWISGSKNSPLSDTANITVTCSKVPEPIKPTTLTKVADKKTYMVGDDITYTIGYKQTHGANFTDVSSSSADWKLDKWTIANGKLTAGQGTAGLATYNKSTSKNGYMEFTCTPATYQWFTILMRQGSASPIKIVLHTIDASQLGIYVYNGSTLVSKQDPLIYGKGLPFTMKIDLNEDLLRIWVNKDTSASPNFSASGLPIGVGTMGFSNGDATGGQNSGMHQLSNINIHTDYAYDLSIIDRKPAEVEFVSADNSGKLYTSAAGDSIVWTGIAKNPIAYGDSFTVSWKGKVTDCVTSIINVAYAKLLGHADNEIMAQAVTGCGASACALDSAYIASTNKTRRFCATDSLVLKATPDPKGTYYYQFYKDGKSLGKMGKADSVIVRTAGVYKVTIYNTADTTCRKTSDTFEVWVDTVPATILTDTSACTGTSIALKATATSVKGYTYEWSDGSTASTLTVSKEGTYSVKVANGLCTVSDTATVRFGSVTLKGGIFTLNGKAYDRATSDTGSICADSSATLAMNYVADEGKYTWSSTPADASLTTGADGKSVSVSPKAATTYYVRFVQGCDAVDSFTVTIGKPMKVSVKTDTLCDSLQLTASTDAAVTATYAWSLGGDAVEGNPLLIDGTVYPKGTVSVTATAMGACPSEPLDIKYENVTMTLQVDGSPSVCPGKKAGIKALATTTGLAAPAYTYSWTDATGAAIGTTDSVNAGPGSYTLTAGNGYCHRTATHKITEGSGELKGDLTVNGTKVVGNPAKTYGSCGGPVDIVADYAHDAGTDFEWSVNGVVQSGTTSTLSLTPKAKTVVTLKFTNECSAYDTLTITMLDSVKIGTTSIIPECGKTSLTVSSAIPSGTRFSWYAAGDTISGKALTIGIADSTSGHGTVRLQGKAAGYCDSRVMDMTFTIDTLGVSLTALPTVCSGAPARLTAKAANTDPANKITYSYAQRKAGSTAAFTVITGASGATCETAALTEPTEFEVTATDGICTHTDTVTVGIGVPARDGHLTVDGITIDSVNAKGVKTYRTCGDGPLALSVTHKATDETSFSWTADSTDAGKGRDITVTPAATTQYVVSYVNGCPATDTVSIEVHPLAVSADWTAFGAELCEGSSASVPLTLTGYSAKDAGAYIRWYKDGKELAANDGAATLSLTGLKAADSGTYTYKVSNGVCTKPAAGAADSGKLTVKPYATVTAAATEYIVGRGNDTILTLATTPADASVAWYENSATGRTPAGTGNPYPLKDVQADHSLTAVASAIGYCPDSIGLGVLVDAKAVIRFRSAGDSICAGDALTLTADTTGTGKLLFPGKYEISYSLLATDGKYKSIQGSGATITVTPTLATTYKATVTYGSQTVSDTLRVTVFAKATYTLDYSKLICAGTASQITVNDLDPSDAQVAWNGDSTLNGDGKSVTVTPSESTTYSFTISQNGGACRQTVKVPVSTIAPVNIIMAADTAICQGDVIALTASVTGAPKFYRWTAAGSDSLLGVSPRVSVSPKSTTAYTLTAGNGVCDSATATITVKVNELPVIDSIVKTDVRTEKVLASGGSEPYQYAVAGGSYQSGDEITLPTYGAHVFHVLDANGCTASKLDTLVAPKIIVPVVVTPNGDGKNDVFTVPGLKEAYPDAKITIYDRWGKKLADYKASDGDWDGTYNGHQMPSTDYWYEISVDEIDKTYTGHFTLLRSK